MLPSGTQEDVKAPAPPTDASDTSRTSVRAPWEESVARSWRESAPTFCKGGMLAPVPLQSLGGCPVQAEPCFILPVLKDWKAERLLGIILAGVPKRHDVGFGVCFGPM